MNPAYLSAGRTAAQVRARRMPLATVIASAQCGSLPAREALRMLAGEQPAAREALDRIESALRCRHGEM